MNNRGHAQEITSAANRKILRIEIKRNRINNLLPTENDRNRGVSRSKNCLGQHRLQLQTSYFIVHIPMTVTY